MIDDYLSGKLPALADIPMEEPKPGFLDKMKVALKTNPFSREDKVVHARINFANNQDLLDTLWGYYFATGSHVPIWRILSVLAWSKSHDTIDKLTVGSLARYTLASYAVRDAGLREYLRGQLKVQPKAVAVPLGEVVEVAAVDDMKTKGSDSRRDLDFWGQVGVGAVALGCVSAAALGQIEVGIPCVIGGSASQGLLSVWEKQQ
jgi:hypothetical protein